MVLAANRALVEEAIAGADVIRNPIPFGLKRLDLLRRLEAHVYLTSRGRKSYGVFQSLGAKVYRNPTDIAKSMSSLLRKICKDLDVPVVRQWRVQAA